MTLDADERRALNDFTGNLHRRLPRSVMHVELFGSKARGDSHADSDIDVLVVLSEAPSPAVDSVYDLVMDVLLETGVYLSVLVYDQQEFSALVARRTPFMKNVSEEGVDLWSKTGESRLLPIV